MIGYGEHATFIKIKKDKKYKTVDGVIVSAGTTLEKEQKKFKIKEKNICLNRNKHLTIR